MQEHGRLSGVPAPPTTSPLRSGTGNSRREALAPSSSVCVSVSAGSLSIPPGPLAACVHARKRHARKSPTIRTPSARGPAWAE